MSNGHMGVHLSDSLSARHGGHSPGGDGVKFQAHNNGLSALMEMELIRLQQARIQQQQQHNENLKEHSSPLPPDRKMMPHGLNSLPGRNVYLIAVLYYNIIYAKFKGKRNKGDRDYTG